MPALNKDHQLRSRKSVRDENINGPKVGIFWLLSQKLVVDSTPVGGAENYANCKTHGRSHQEYWDQLTRAGSIADGDYEEHPRGRVVYHTETGQFTIYADKCIVRKKAVVKKIVRQMHLPTGTVISTDSHYRCFKCLKDEAAAY
jgi:hypothetical protein